MKHKAGILDYLTIILLGLFAIGFVLPQGETAGELLVISTFLLGFLGLIRLVSASEKLYGETGKVIYRVFIFLTSAGLSIVLFVFTLFACIFLWFYKNPLVLDNVHCG